LDHQWAVELAEVGRIGSIDNQIVTVKSPLTASKINLQNITVSIKAHEHDELEDRMTEIERQLKEREAGWAR
jgi:hypothetical protein